MSRIFGLSFLVAATVAAAASAAAPPPLPLTGQYIETVTRGAVAQGIRLSGRVPSTAGGERVTIFGRECLARYARQLAGTQTVRGGFWEVTLGGRGGNAYAISTGVTYRARWKGRWSVRFTFRRRLHPGVERLSGDRFRVTVPNATPLQSLAGKPVVLQRATGNGFADVQTARLRIVDARLFSATFVVRTSGLTLRALVPIKTARPCYNAGASANFTS